MSSKEFLSPIQMSTVDDVEHKVLALRHMAIETSLPNSVSARDKRRCIFSHE
jgi:hypothetical protein